jgi:hypothetical protein
MSSHTKKKYLILPLLFVIIFMFWPYEHTIAPERKFRVVDENTMPIKSALVRQSWYQYSLGITGEERKTTGVDGAVVFQKRTVRTRRVDLFCGAIKKILEYTIHASIGPSDTIVVSASGYEKIGVFDGEGLGDTVVLKRK